MDTSAGIAAAVALAQQALEDDVGGPFGTIVVQGGRVVGRGRNRVLADHDPTAHAEVLAIRDACRTLGTHDLRGSVVYASSEPCPMCLGALYWARVDRVMFGAPREEAARVGFDDAFLYEELSRPRADRRLVVEHVPTPAATEVLTRWAARPDRTPY